MAEVASAYVSLLPSARGWEREVSRQIDSGTTRAGKTAGAKSGKAFSGSFSGAIKGVFAAAGGLAIGHEVISFFHDSNAEAREAQRVGALTDQVIKSTGKSAKVTRKHVEALASSLSNKVGVDDEAIQSGENLLLTFTNVRNEVGKGNKIFDSATRVITDMSAALGQDTKSSAIQLGKALNDPVKGITALSRVGVSFTKQQKDQIKTLVKSGKTLQAQKVILRELRKEFGGAAKSQVTDGDKATVAIKNLEEQIGTALLPIEDKLARFTTNELVPAVSKFVTGMEDGTGAGGQFVDVLGEAADIGKDVLAFFNGIPGPVKKYGVELLIAGVALNKINNGLIAGRTAVGGWVSSLGPAEATMTRTSKAAYAFGVGLRNLAGAGGLVALQRSTHDTNVAVVGLERTLGGAASGFAVGGPIGGAIGGLGGLFSTAWQAIRATGKENKITLPTFKEYAVTLDGVAAATTKATREMAFQRLEQAGLLGATRDLGLTDREAVRAVLGQAEARKKLADALVGNTQISFAQKRALEQETGALGASRLAQLKKNVAIAGSREELRKAQAALKAFMAEPASKRVSIVGVEEATTQLRALRRGLKEALGLTKDLNTAGSGGIDLLLSAPLRPKRHAIGGHVKAGETFIGGERGPERFTTSQAGRMTSTNALRAELGGGTQELIGTLGIDRDGIAYIRGVARGAVDSGAAARQRSRRMAGLGGTP